MFTHQFSMTSFRPRIPGTTACDRLRHPRGYGAGQSGGTMQHTKTRNVSDALPQTDFFSTMASIHQVALLDALPPPTYLTRIFQGKAGERGEEGETQYAAIQALPCCYLRRAAWAARRSHSSLHIIPFAWWRGRAHSLTNPLSCRWRTGWPREITVIVVWYFDMPETHASGLART